MRDPRIDPRPGDILRQGERGIAIRFVDDKYVYFDRFHGEEPAHPAGRMEIDTYRECAKQVTSVQEVQA